MSITGEPDGEPQKVGVALVDVICGLFAAVGVLAAVRHRERTGEGQRVEVDLLSSLLAALVNQGSAFTLAGHVAARMGNAHPSIAPYELMRAADGHLVVAVGNDRQFRRAGRGARVPGARRRTRPSRRMPRAWPTGNACAAILEERLAQRPAVRVGGAALAGARSRRAGQRHRRRVRARGGPSALSPWSRCRGRTEARRD